MKFLSKISLLTVLLIGYSSCNLNAKNHEVSTTVAKLEHHPNKQFIKVALLLDTSNSMDGLIDQAKAQLWEIVNELSYARCDNERPNLQIALYEYGNDGLNPEKGYIRQVLSFSEDLDEIAKELFSLTTNGGSEYCGQVIQTSLNQLKWGKNPDDLKLVFIAGNEPFTQGRVSYRLATSNANEKDITVNTIFCGNYREGINTSWKDGADRTNGDYMAIDHNLATVHIVSPYDDAILILNTKLNKTYVSYGNQGRAKKELQQEQDTNAEGYSSANAVSRTVSKSSHLYKNSTWDLVDAVEMEEVVVEDLKDDALPEELKGKSAKEIKAYVEQKKVERQSIKKEIQELNEKRRKFIADKQKENKNGLENAMINAIKSQAKKKNYNW
ncbi:MAG: VWA domain-containing protein [Desulfobacterales bacterium]|nr:VWA domain-containing protein [Desulfobacterales bacterium]